MANRRPITFMGQTLTMTEWARKYNIDPRTLHHRLKSGMSIKDALFTPMGAVKRKIINVSGQQLSYDEIAKMARVKRSTIYSRRVRGWKTNELLIVHNQYKITANGKTMSVSEWAKELGVRSNLIYQRINRGWSHDAIVNTPITPLGRTRAHKMIKAFGKEKTMHEWARESGMAWSTLHRRLANGMPPEVAIKTPPAKHGKKKEST